MTLPRIGQSIARYRQEAARYLQPVRDESGRIVAPPQSIDAERPAGQWNQNADQRSA